MGEAQDTFQQHVRLLVDVVMFESWLRFYFIVDAGEGEEEKLEMRVPEKAMGRIEELYPRFYPLGRQLNDHAIDFATSRDAVLNFIAAHIDGTEMERGEAQRVLQSRAFQTRLQLFHTWEQMHEDQLDQGFLDFGSFRDLFDRWLETPGAKDLAHRLQETPETSGS